MKLVILLSFVSIATCQFAIRPDQMQKLMQFNTECQKETGAKQKDIMGVIQGKFSEDPALKAHIVCLGKKLGFIDDAGQINREAIKEKVSELSDDPKKIDAILDKCIVQKDTPEDTAFESIKCVSDNRKMIMPN